MRMSCKVDQTDSTISFVTPACLHLPRSSFVPNTALSLHCPCLLQRLLVFALPVNTQTTTKKELETM
eukprot:m.216347 g.216347  ORF g.216347 m.216347 type:complete len:67 (-) comp13803_c1_seq35:849-1049(-)